jgi:hypothetical protein
LKKITAIFFFTLYLFSTTETHQLLKLPVVFQHFKEHKKEDKNITLLQFLAMHYLHGSPKDKDYERDMQLPFKTSGDCLSSVVPAFVPSINEICTEKPIEIAQKEKGIPQNQFLLSTYLASIWQPPKSC